MPRPRVAAADVGALGLAIDQLVAWGVLSYAYAVLAVPLAAELGLTIETVAAGASVSLLVSAVLARSVGRAIDRGRAGAVMIAGAATGALALLMLSSVRDPWTLAVTCVLLGIAQALSLYEVAFAAVVTAFPEPQVRARAMVVITTVAGLASTVFVPLTGAWIGCLGWRGAAATLAAVLLAVTLPLRWRRKERIAARTTQPIDDRRPPGFARLVVGLALQSSVTTGTGATLLWRLLDGGASMDAAAWSVGLVGASQLPGRWAAAPLQRWCAAAWRMPAVLAVHAAAVGSIGVTTGAIGLVALVAFGATAGLLTLERAAIVLDRGGPAAFGRRFGEVAAVSGFSRAAAPWGVVAVAAALGWPLTYAALAVVLVVAGAVLVAPSSAGKMRREPSGT